jgi:hypothetical protein
VKKEAMAPKDESALRAMAPCASGLREEIALREFRSRYEGNFANLHIASGKDGKTEGLIR